MKAKVVLVAAGLVLANVVLSGSVFAAEQHEAVKEAAAGSNVLYVCNCKDNCKCNSVSVKPGKCACGSDLVDTHILKIKGNKATLCTCGKDCTCKLDESNPSNCACGHPVKEADLKGLYICNCKPGGCGCNTVSDKPGKCKCGKELQKVE
jgi:hypothetical protein